MIKHLKQNIKTMALIQLVGTAHDFSNVLHITVMHRAVVQDFFREYQDDLSRTNTLLIVEGSPFLQGDGRHIYSYNSKHSDKLLRHTFGSFPYWIRSWITVADQRSIGLQYDLLSLTQRISRSGGIIMKKPLNKSAETTSAEILTGIKDYEACSVSLKYEPYCDIDFTMIASKAFYGKRSSLEEAKKIIHTVHEGCNQPIINTIEKWQNDFRKIIVVAGLLHTSRISTQQGFPHQNLLPPKIKNVTFKNGSDEDNVALGLIFYEDFYKQVSEFCK